MARNRIVSRRESQLDSCGRFWAFRRLRYWTRVWSAGRCCSEGHGSADPLAGCPVGDPTSSRSEQGHASHSLVVTSRKRHFFRPARHGLPQRDKEARRWFAEALSTLSKPDEPCLFHRPLRRNIRAQPAHFWFRQEAWPCGTPQWPTYIFVSARSPCPDTSAQMRN